MILKFGPCWELNCTARLMRWKPERARDACSADARSTRLALACALVCLLVGSAGFAQAQTADIAAAKKQKCAIGSMIDLNICLDAEREESDARLNEIYRIVIAALADPEPLRKAQRAWILFRDAHCSFEIPPSWIGSAIPYMRNDCLIRHTERRIQDLEQVAPCNGCVEFKPEIYDLDHRWELPHRQPSWEQPWQVPNLDGSEGG